MICTAFLRTNRHHVIQYINIIESLTTFGPFGTVTLFTS